MLTPMAGGGAPSGRLLERIRRREHQRARPREILEPVELPLLDALRIGIAPQRRTITDARRIILRGQPIGGIPPRRAPGKAQHGKQNQSLHGRTPHLFPGFIPFYSDFYPQLFLVYILNRTILDCITDRDYSVIGKASTSFLKKRSKKLL
jgi:hypothetical protein